MFVVRIDVHHGDPFSRRSGILRQMTGQSVATAETGESDEKSSEFALEPPQFPWP